MLKAAVIYVVSGWLSARNNLVPTGWSVMKFDIWGFQYNLTWITGTLHEDICTFMIISYYILLTARNVSDKICGKNQEAHFLFNNSFSKNHTIYEIMWKDMVQPERTTHDNIIWCTCFARWITKQHRHTYTHNMWYKLLFHGHSDNTNAPHSYAICTLPVFLFVFWHCGWLRV